ncbi:MAG: hypothetical protein HRT88_17045 [Lentisphaeraceae bacterium]|nr:hypothetical protein [Lentisphaeraceae bacterium]
MKNYILTMALLVAVSTQALEISDNFNRANSSELGATSDGKDKWVENQRPPQHKDSLKIFENKVKHKYTIEGGEKRNAALLEKTRLKDGEISFVVKATDYYTFRGVGILYRGVSEWNSYKAFVAKDSISLMYQNREIASTGSDFKFISGTKEFKVVFVGDKHKLYLDGKLVLEHTDARGNVSGLVGFHLRYTHHSIDDFKAKSIDVKKVKEPKEKKIKL